MAAAFDLVVLKDPLLSFGVTLVSFTIIQCIVFIVSLSIVSFPIIMFVQAMNVGST